MAIQYSEDQLHDYNYHAHINTNVYQTQRYPRAKLSCFLTSTSENFHLAEMSCLSQTKLVCSAGFR